MNAVDKFNMYLYIDAILASEKIIHHDDKTECVLVPVKFLKELKQELKNDESRIEMSYLDGGYDDKPIGGFHDDMSADDDWDDKPISGFHDF